MAKKPAKKRITPQQWRAKFPKALDKDFADAISVTEAAVILGCTDTWVRKLIQTGALKGKVLTRTAYVVSEKDARKKAAEYPTEPRPHGGRPRSKAI